MAQDSRPRAITPNSSPQNDGLKNPDHVLIRESVGIQLNDRFIENGPAILDHGGCTFFIVRMTEGRSVPAAPPYQDQPIRPGTAQPDVKTRNVFGCHSK